MVGAIYCSVCGALLAGNHGTQKKQEQAVHAQNENGKENPPLRDGANNLSKVSLLMVKSGERIPLSDNPEITLGRSVTGQPIVPDVDLSPYDGYSNGVSRIHAVIKVSSGSVAVMDLDSSNGTFVNGRQLKPNQDCPLLDDDLLCLGTLNIQVEIKH
jgi:pSer/pThr/pTyr-binding forkhead associated (FHA) protein